MTARVRGYGVHQLLIAAADWLAKSARGVALAAQVACLLAWQAAWAAQVTSVAPGASVEQVRKASDLLTRAEEASVVLALSAAWVEQVESAVLAPWVVSLVGWVAPPVEAA